MKSSFLHTLLHTPEGVRDIYLEEFEIKEQVETRIKQQMARYGFRQISTPAFEYFDIFNKERGTVPSRDMYKFIDRDGETLVLRPDITPQVVRCVAKYFHEEILPIRLCYHGNTYLNRNGYQGKLKESTQLGAELFNDAGVAADAEMAALMIDCLLAAGLSEFQVEIGQADFFRALAEEARFSKEEADELRELIETKNMFAVERLLNEKELSIDLKKLFLELPARFGTIEIVRRMKELTSNPRALAALSRLEQLYDVLCLYGKEEYVSFDLGMLNQYNYYTGVIFQAYTHGTGEVVAAGGRYDTLVGQFGKEAPAIGIAVYSDQLLTALARQGLTPETAEDKTLLLYTERGMAQAVLLAKQFRSEGLCVVLAGLEENKVETAGMEGRERNDMALENAAAAAKGDMGYMEYKNYAARIGAGGILVVNGSEMVRVINLQEGTEQEVPFGAVG